ncbi:hypothetical protein E3N88_00089 [Mikania micrantha]|uniref:Uncharacterized protein n=1 Tax=Mikania micrantha TaxID=192012 RepID=A0A5N6PXZ2_9ASTR|nr:hypothetical protein E3N88_00089 [Mikania micrantha]
MSANLFCRRGGPNLCKKREKEDGDTVNVAGDVERRNGSTTVWNKSEMKNEGFNRVSGADEPIRLTRASKARATTNGYGPSRSDKGKQHALYDEDDEIEKDIGVLDGEGDGPMLGDNDTIDLDFY